MKNEKIHLLTQVQSKTLIVFYTPGKCWQFRVLSQTGEIFGEEGLFYTAEAAEKAGREWVGG